MSSALYELGRFCYRHRGRILVGWILALVVLGATAALVSKPFSEEFAVPGTESQQALDQLNRTFPQLSGTSAQIVVVSPADDTVRDPAIRSAVSKTVDNLHQLGFVDAATSPYDDTVSGMVSANGRAAIIQVQLTGSVSDVTDAERQQLTDQAVALTNAVPGLAASAGGEAFGVEVPAISITEGLGLVVALVVLLLTLGSFRAAGMPLLTAVLGVGVSMTLVLAGTALMTVSSTTPILAVMLGLAVGIDYALFIVSRHREQLAEGLEPEESTARAIGTAGSAVVFAGLTVIIALVGLAVARIGFLTVMGVAAAVAVVIAVLIALTLLPALLGFAGARLTPRVKGLTPRVKGLTPRVKGAPRGRRSRRAGGLGKLNHEQGLDQQRTRTPRSWAATWVAIATRAPLVTIVVVIAALGALAIPAAGLRLALPNAGDAQPGTAARTTFDLVGKHFGPGFNGPLLVTTPIVTSTDPVGLMSNLQGAVEEIPGVAAVPVATPNATADTGILQVVPTTGPTDPATAELVQRIRDRAPQLDAQYGVELKVTGFTAVAIDVSDRLGSALLPFGIFVVGLSLFLLALVFRSIAVPVKATLGYLLSVGAAFGATTAVFVDGHGASLINLATPGPVISFLPIILMGVLFGLAMDYEVFLVSRIREEYVHDRSDRSPKERARRAVHTGFVSSSRVVAAAAVIMFSVFAFFVPEGDGSIKPIAFGLAVGVFVDAFIVRMTLVPAVLTLLGDKAWWLPRRLERHLPHFDVEGEGLRRRLALADWPRADARHVVYAEGLAGGTDPSTRFGPLDVVLDPYEVLLVEGDAARRTAFLLALSGRLPSEGMTKVCGHLLPDQAAAVRHRTAWLTRGALGSRRTPRGLGDPVLIMDDADRLDDDGRRRLAQILAARAIPDLADPEVGTATILGVSDGAALLSDPLLPAPDRVRILRLGAPEPAVSSTPLHSEELVDVLS